jgi:hypothetical protein
MLLEADASSKREDDFCSESSFFTEEGEEEEGGEEEKQTEVESVLRDIESTRDSTSAASLSSTSPSTRISSSTVRFSVLEIRCYPMILGDNPSVTNGIPVTIDWKHDESVVCDVEEYEESRPPRRDRAELMLPSSIRSRLAMDTGSSRKELQEQLRQVNIQRNQRRRTLEREQLDRLEEALEKTWRVISGKKKRERKFMQQASSAFAIVTAVN